MRCLYYAKDTLKDNVNKPCLQFSFQSHALCNKYALYLVIAGKKEDDNVIRKRRHLSHSDVVLFTIKYSLFHNEVDPKFWALICLYAGQIFTSNTSK